MELVFLGGLLIIPHEVLILYNILVAKIFGYTKLRVHVAEHALGKLFIVINLPHFIDVIASHSFYSYFINVSLSSRAELCLLFNI